MLPNFLRNRFTSQLLLLATPFIFIWIGIYFISKIAESGIHGFLHPEAEQRLYLLTQNSSLQYRLFSVHINDAYQGRTLAGILDFIDYQFVHYSLNHQFIHFYSITAIFCIVAIFFITYHCLHKQLLFSKISAYLLSTLLLSSNSYIFALPLFRSSKVYSALCIAATISLMISLLKKDRGALARMMLLLFVTLIGFHVDAQGAYLQIIIYLPFIFFCYQQRKKLLYQSTTLILFICLVVKFITLFYLEPSLILKFSGETINLKYTKTNPFDLLHIDILANGVMYAFHGLSQLFGSLLFVGIGIPIFWKKIAFNNDLKKLDGFIFLALFLLFAILFQKHWPIAWVDVRLFGYYLLPVTTIYLYLFSINLAAIKDVISPMKVNLAVIGLILFNLVSIYSNLIYLKNGHLQLALSEDLRGVLRNPTEYDLRKLGDRPITRYIRENRPFISINHQ
ncbi:hypothetical protein G6734_03980 [Polynucleobacter paneuropaeus]|nr:hypothetical protein [Polynucleobacter paneuropaeus]